MWTYPFAFNTFCCFCDTDWYSDQGCHWTLSPMCYHSARLPVAHSLQSLFRKVYSEQKYHCLFTLMLFKKCSFVQYKINEKCTCFLCLYWPHCTSTITAVYLTHAIYSSGAIQYCLLKLLLVTKWHVISSMYFIDCSLYELLSCVKNRQYTSCQIALGK